MTHAAHRNTTRQPNAPPSMPLTVRESRMPASTPPITLPTIRPRSFGSPRLTANGKIICVIDAPSPIATLATVSSATVGANENASRANAAPIAVVTITPRRSRTSPSGTGSNIPAA